jgi:hypothetical protein
MGPTATALRQYGCARTFHGAWAILTGSERALVSIVVLRNVAIRQAAAQLGLKAETATERLVEALERLARYWDIRGDQAA